MKRLKQVISIMIVIVSIILLASVISPRQTLYKPEVINPNDVAATYKKLNQSIKQSKDHYLDFLEAHGVNYNPDIKQIDATLIEGIQVFDKKVLESDNSATYEVNILEAGLYYLNLEYMIQKQSLSNATISVAINDEFQYEEQKTIDLSLAWKDQTKNFDIDRYGDEVLPSQSVVSGFRYSYLYANTYITVDPLMFLFESGKQKITIKNVSSTTLEVAALVLRKPVKTPNYSEYRKNHEDTYVKDIIHIDARMYTEKSSSYTHLMSYNSPNVAPFDAVYKKLNVIDGSSWLNPGQDISYTFHVKNAGDYYLTFHYLNDKKDFSVFRSIMIDGNIPFAECKSYEFLPTGGSKWQNETLNDGTNNYRIYLESGEHTITLKAESEPLAKALRYLQLVIDHINGFSLDIRKISGKDVDKNRSWKFTEDIPETVEYLKSYEILLKEVINELSLYAPNGYQSSTLSYIQKALYKLINIAKKPDHIPLYLNDLIGGTGSIAQYLGDSLTSIQEQPLYLNSIYVNHDENVPKANATIFKKFWASVKSFFSTFTSSKFKLEQDDEAITVWVNRPITHVDLMQKMADQTFTKETGIKVKISVMQDVNKLIMASATNQQPDVALGLPSYTPYDLAIRNAAYDLTSFDDYWYFVSDFAPGAFIPFILNDKAYAVAETLDFNVLMYRKDVFDGLGFMVPDTWYEVIDILPELQQYGMNFYHPIAGGGGIKWFYQTSGFIYQFGGQLYSNDGLTTTINTNEAVAGLTFLNQLFTNYSLPEQVQSFYNSFRYATLPIGIADFQTYLLIKNAAPEIKGQWALSSYPSYTVNDVANRYYIANGSSGVVLKSTKAPNDSWSFLKWWMKAETQTDFAFNLESTYGPTYAWLSANLKAFENSPFPEADRKIIQEQLKWLIDVPRTPGQYMVERSISDIWNTAVMEGTQTGVAVDKYSIQMNREVKRKMIEFGFIDNQGQVLKPYLIRDIEWIKEQMRRAKGD